MGNELGQLGRPIKVVGNAHKSNGQWARGNPGGPGNPNLRAIGALRSEMLRAITPKEIRAIVKKLIDKAKRADVFAAREVLDRACGKPAVSISVEQGFSSETPMTDALRQLNNELIRFRRRQLDDIAKLESVRGNGSATPR